MKLIKVTFAFLIFFMSISCSKSDDSNNATNDSGKCGPPYDAVLTMYIDGKLFTYDARAELMNDINASKRFLKAESCGRAYEIDGSPVINFENDEIELLQDYQIIAKKLYSINDVSFGSGGGHGGVTCFFDENNIMKYYQAYNDYFVYIDENGNYTSNMGQFDLKSRLNYQIVNLYAQNDITKVTKCDVNFSGVLYRTGNHNDSIVISQGRIRY